jgi:hypothetical protein
MSFIYIADLVKINSQDDLSNVPDWAMGSTNIGVMYGGFWVAQNQFPYGSWLCKLSDGNLIGQTEEQVQTMAQSMPALARAGLVATGDIPKGTIGRFVSAFKDSVALVYAQAQMVDEDDPDNIGIKVLERSPYRDELTRTIDHERTWLIIGSEYVSGQVVDAVRLSDFVKTLEAQHVEFTLGPRGPQ